MNTSSVFSLNGNRVPLIHAQNIPTVERIIAKMDLVHTSCVLVGYGMTANPSLTYDVAVRILRDCGNEIPPEIKDELLVPNKMERKIMYLMCRWNFTKDEAMRIIQVQAALRRRARDASPDLSADFSTDESEEESEEPIGTRAKPRKKSTDGWYQPPRYTRLVAEKRTKQSPRPPQKRGYSPDVPITIDDDKQEELKYLIGIAEEEFNWLKAKLEPLIKEEGATTADGETKEELEVAMARAEKKLKDLKSQLEQIMQKEEPTTTSLARGSSLAELGTTEQ